MSTFAIDENHSDIVKFREGDANCDVVLGKLREICTAHEEVSMHGSRAGLGERPVEMTEDRSLEDKKIAILKALHTSPYRDRKERNPDRVPGTCEWFVTHERFRQWRDGESAAMLWVSADPGSGKSVLAKYLVDSELPTTESRTTCYFFFKDDFEDQRSAKDALSCILHQLFQNKKILFSHKIVERFETYGGRLTGSFAELWDLLLMVSRDTNAGEIVCILDALDECEGQARSELSQALCKFFSARNNFNLKFLLTSRPLGEIRRGFQPLNDIPGLPVIRLEGESDTETEKIAKEIEVYIHARVQRIQALLRLKPGEAGLLLRRLLSIPHRTYLWVYLTLDLVQNDINIDKAGIDKATSLLPRTVDDAYERILAKSSDVGKARKLLSIVVAATRPLTLAEMDVALTLREDHRSYKDLDLKSEKRFLEYVRDLCGLFVSVTDSKIYLLHQTAKSFLVQDGPLVAPQIGSTNRLLWKSSLRPQQCHRLLWQISTWYLRFTDFETTPLDGTKKLSQYLHDHLFLDYSARNWAVHFRQSGIRRDAATTQSLLEVCNAKSLGSLTWFNVYWASVHDGFPRDFTTLMIASYFGIGPVVRKLLKGVDVGVNSRDGTYQRSALSWASENGFDDVVGLLIKGPKVRVKHMIMLSSRERAEIDARDIYGRTPLSYAAWNGHAVIAGLLVKAGARADLEDEIEGTPLSYAICSGNKAVTKVLQKSANMVGSADNIVRALLFSAAKKGDEFVVKRLLGMDKGLDIDAKDNAGRTPLSWAAENGHGAVVQLLLAKGKADIDTKDIVGRTPLVWAAGNGHEAVIQLLRATGKADIDAKDHAGRTPLSWAAENGHGAVVQLLLATGKADIDAKDHAGRTPLSWAAENGHGAVIQLLLATGRVDIDTKDIVGRTPLVWAAGNGHEAVIQLLRATGKADIDAKDHAGRTPLSWAAGSGHEAIVQLLLATGRVHNDMKDNFGRTPLAWAAGSGYEAVVQLLLATGRVHNGTEDNIGRTPLAWAAGNGHEAVVQLLLATGRVDIDTKDNIGRTPLSWAAGNGHEAVVQLLLATGRVDIDTKDKFGRTPLLWAASRGREAVVQLLRNPLNTQS
jgi:ankyrin repeat protein